MSTRLLGKEHSPLTVRKYTNLHGLGGIPVYVALITDDDLSSLDAHVHEFARAFHSGRHGRGLNTLQDFRVFAGALTERLAQVYASSEGVAVILFPDKSAIASLRGDFMNCHMCRKELYDIIQVMVHI
jgi:hypothetical protein